jgi:hypothetical protein
MVPSSPTLENVDKANPFSQGEASGHTQEKEIQKQLLDVEVGSADPIEQTSPSGLLLWLHSPSSGFLAEWPLPKEIQGALGLILDDREDLCTVQPLLEALLKFAILSDRTCRT